MGSKTRALSNKFQDLVFVGTAWFCALTIENVPADFYLFSVTNSRDFLIGWAVAGSLWWIAHMTEPKND
ncbi:MAG: hypothetical protein MN733_10495 [Nitrososphaera sp.]|nr:hypothetical protein [Nitrososphaera sp.]